MYQQLESLSKLNNSSDNDEFSNGGFQITESSDGLTLSFEIQIYLIRSGNEVLDKEFEFHASNLSTTELAQFKNLIDDWLSSKSRPSLNTSFSDVSGKFKKKQFKRRHGGSRQDVTEYEFETFDMYLSEGGIAFFIPQTGSETLFTVPGSELVVDMDPKDFKNIHLVRDTIFDYFDIENDADIDEIDIAVQPSIGGSQAIDEELMRRSVSEFESGHFQSSVRTAFTVLEERIRMIGGYEESDFGSRLVQDAFHPENGPLLFGETEGERTGVMFLYRGAFQALRNPASHRFIDQVDEDYARDTIHTVNLLLRLLEINVS